MTKKPDPSSGYTPMTRTTVAETLQQNRPDRLRVGVYEGCETVPDPTNLAVFFRFTGNPCSVNVKANNIVSLSFVGGDVFVARHSIGDTFVGHTSGEEVLIVQWLEETGQVLDTTLTSYDYNGNVNYGRSGEGNYTMSCHILNQSLKERHCG